MLETEKKRRKRNWSTLKHWIITHNDHNSTNVTSSQHPRFVELIQWCCLTFWVSNQPLQLKQKYSPTSIIRTSIIRISQLPGVCLAFKKQKQRSHASQLIKNIRLRSSWLRVALLLSENELLTSPQLSDEQILESVVEQSSLEDESSGD